MPQFLTFSVSDKNFCIDVRDIQEIAELDDFQKVPKAPACIKGVSSLRGKIVTLVEISDIFQIRCEPRVPFCAVILAPPHNNLAFSVYSEFSMKEGAEHRSEGAKKGLFSSSAEIEGLRSTLLQSREIVTFCEQKVLESFKIANAHPARNMKSKKKV